MSAMSQHPCKYLWLAVLCTLPLMAATPAYACWCRPLGEVLWPTAGSDVSADTAIVIEARPDITEPNPYDVTLRGPDGKEIALEEMRRLPRTFSCNGDIVFLRPESELRPGMKYEVTMKKQDTEELVKFSTREKSRRPQAATHPDVTYLSVAQHPNCERGQCFDLAEVRVELEHALHERTWLQIRSGADRFQLNRWDFTAGSWSAISRFDPEAEPMEDPERVGQISVPLPSADPCVEIAIYGIDGHALFEEKRCEPDRCAVYQQRLQSSCVEPPSSALDPIRLSPTSCENPPTIDDLNGYPEFDAGVPEEPASAEQDEVRLRTKRAPDCQASPLSAARTLPWPLVLITAAGMLLQRRRRLRYEPTARLSRSARPNA
jgi:hypothetical protein